MARQTCGQLASVLGAAALLFLSGCDEPSPQTDGRAFAAPVTSLRATLALEPSELKIGEVATAEITVVTPPEHHLHPVNPPEVAGVWLLDAETLEVERSPARWVHRARIRVRTRDIGALIWPAFEVTVEDAAGAKSTVAVAERSFEVVSVLKDFPDRAVPFGLHGPEQSEATRGGFWVGVAAGAGGALALAAVGLALHRTRDRIAPDGQSGRVGVGAPEATLWDWSERELEQANSALDSPAEEGARDAANRGALLLRRYVARRFNVQTEAFTTEELSARKPPLAIDSRWPELLRILRRFDAERFRQVESDDASAARIKGELDAVRRFIEDSMPPELRR